MPRVLVTDYTFSDLDIERRILEPLGCEFVARQHKSAETLVADVIDTDAVITQFAPVNAAVIAAMTKARVIVRYGVGVDNVDLAAARGKGIPVCNVPDYCIDEVADHTLAFILATTRQVVTNCVHVRKGNWGLATPLDKMRKLCDLTVGVVGFGRIGREVAARLRAFKCRILVHDPNVAVAEIERAGYLPVAQREILAQSDILTLHCPSTAQTREMINRESLAAMRPGMILINIARGDLVDSAALIEALRSGHVSAAALDVFAPEPIPADHPILKMDNVIVASHVGAASVSAVSKLRETAANLAAMALRGEALPSVVN